MNHMEQYAVLVEAPITPATLRTLSDNLATDIKYAAAFGRSADGKLKRACRAREWALLCADEMERTGLTSAQHFGPFSTTLFRKHQKVKVKAGGVRFSTNPRVPSAGEIVRRPYYVNLFAAYAGRYDGGGKTPFIHPQVHWIGTGNYYYWANPNDVEQIGAPPVTG
ncbi:hypothetical protein GCM10019059_39170 [Camelimonas fluminis]|uniref:Uncharacterized protein n=1 Tax=Camelimonas fluminis TaxID=1576911 RepID=A0ABV7UJW3_9HYPH|nr:hypothetical protein [Camelimonas fluminis]GHE75985.1 hypothetical protein GCM10019059_39170 [Camelimonas fluminis]